MSNNYHEPKNRGQSSFDATQWRTDNAENSAKREFIGTTTLASLLGVMTMGVIGLYFYNTHQTKLAATKMFVANTLDGQDTQQSAKASNINKAEPAAPQPSQISNAYNIHDEIDKYNEARSVMRHCSTHHRQVMGQAISYYYNTNEAKYSKLYDMKYKQGISSSSNQPTAKLVKSMKRMDKIDSRADAIKFVATGGAARHMEASMGVMVGIQKMQATEDRNRALRKQAKDYGFCVVYAHKITNGKMNIQLPKS